MCVVSPSLKSFHCSTAHDYIVFYHFHNPPFTIPNSFSQEELFVCSSSDTVLETLLPFLKHLPRTRQNLSCHIFWARPVMTQHQSCVRPSLMPWSCVVLGIIPPDVMPTFFALPAYSLGQRKDIKKIKKKRKKRRRKGKKKNENENETRKEPHLIAEYALLLAWADAPRFLVFSWPPVHSLVTLNHLFNQLLGESGFRILKPYQLL